jgi:hypothetical protein
LDRPGLDLSFTDYRRCAVRKEGKKKKISKELKIERKQRSEKSIGRE